MLDISVGTLQQFIQGQGWFRIAQHIFVIVVILRFISGFRIQNRGKSGLKSFIIKCGIRVAKKLGFIKGKIEKHLGEQAAKNVSKMFENKKIKAKYGQLPQIGLSKQQLLGILDERISADIDPTKGRTFAYVYEQSKKHSQLTQQCFRKYIHSNALNPVIFNSLRVIQSQVVRISAKLFHGGDQCVGNITSCGTQSLLLAMKTYRDYRGAGDVIMCVSGHPGINKGCHYVGLNCIQIPYDQDKRMSVKHLKKVISSKTVLVVCSAPQYPHGVVDNVQQIAQVCRCYNVPLHVDSAIGGFILPFIEMERKNKIKPWDFRVQGVTSINADCHKYGYAPKGSSVLIFNSSNIRRKQFYTFATWPGGIYISPTALGTRNGGCFSSAWGSLLGLGVQGFRRTTKRILETVDKLVAAITQNKQLKLLAIPDTSIITFTSINFSCYKLADAIEKRGYHLQKQSNPQSLHMSIMPQHFDIVDDLIKQINQSVIEIKQNPGLYESDSKAVYGMMADIPDEVILEDFVSFYMDQVYKYRT